MAGAKRESRRQGERVVPSLDQGTPRVSSAAGRVSANSGQHTRVEQRSNIPSRQGNSGRSAPATTTRQRSSSGKQQVRSSRKSSTGTRVAPSPATASGTKDVQFIKWAGAQWSSLESHQKQRFMSVLLLLFALLLFGALTIFRDAFILSSINKFFLVFFGWLAYPLAFGLVAFALAHLVEGLRNQHFIRWSLVIGLIVICLLLLVESRLLTSHLAVGVLAEVLVAPLLGWPAAIGHVIIIGLLLIVIIVTFRITFGHVLMVADFFRGLFADPERSEAPVEQSLPRGSAATYEGERPQFSRYGNWASSAGSAQASRAGRRVLSEEIEEDDETATELEADFEDEDPRDDINIHRREISTVPRDPRVAPRALNVSEHRAATRGANQQELPFDGEEPPVVHRQHRQVLQPSPDMEPLAPNPRMSMKQKSRTPLPSLPVIVSPWKLPDTALLHSPEEIKLQMLGDDTSALARTIQETLRSFRVDAEVRAEDISIGPTVIRFGIRPTGKPEMKVDEKSGKMIPVRDAAGQIVYETRTRVSRIMALQNDIALVLEAKAIRMEAPVPGRPYVGVEIPNKNSRLVTLREILESKEYQTSRNKSKLAMALGRDVAGLVRVGDLSRMPHLLIAGSTGSGKSVMINALVCSILTQATPDDVRMLMVDPKMVELNLYNGIPHLLAPVVIEVDKVVSLLKNAIAEMERRYRLFSQISVRNLDGYRRLRLEKIAKGDTSLHNLPAIVIIIDELADLMMAAPEEVEGMICRLAQLARATGIHLVIATQRPSVDVITGLIKANIPTRISFMVSSAVDSRTIIDMGGAERLLGRGDMLYLPADAGRPERIQAAFVADDETEVLVDFWRQQVIDHSAATVKDGSLDTPVYTPEIEPGWELREELQSDEFELEDDLLDKAEEVVREYGRASISLLQRRLRVGYSRAARLIDLLEERGIIGQSEGGGRGREVLGHSNDHYEEEGHSLSAVADDIIAEERARNEFLRQQAGRQSQNQLHEEHE